MTIVNSSNAERSLTVATSPVFGWIELHRTVHDGDVAKMVPQDAIKIPAGGRVELKPGDYHLMLMQPSQTLRVGDQISITLEFKNGEMQTISFPVKKQTLSEKIESGAEEKPK
jgi:copper(I)-binding protein